MPTIDGKAEVKVKAGTQPGDKLRMRGYGVKMDVAGQRGRRGDQYVRVMVRVPRHLTAEQRHALEMYKGRHSSSGSSGAGGSSGGGSSGGSSGGSGSSGSSSSGGGERSSSSSESSSAGGSTAAGSGPADAAPGRSSEGKGAGSSGEKQAEEKPHKRSWRDWFST